MIPVGIAVVAAAPAGCFVPLQLSGFGRLVVLEVLGPAAESAFGSAPLAEVVQRVNKGNMLK